MTLTISVRTNQSYADGPIAASLSEITDATPEAITELFNKLALDLSDRVGVQLYNWRLKHDGDQAVQVDA